MKELIAIIDDCELLRRDVSPDKCPVVIRDISDMSILRKVITCTHLNRMWRREAMYSFICQMQESDLTWLRSGLGIWLYMEVEN